MVESSVFVVLWFCVKQKPFVSVFGGCLLAHLTYLLERKADTPQFKSRCTVRSFLHCFVA